MSEKNSIFADTKPDVKIDAIAYNTIEKHVRQKKEHLPLAKFVTNRNSRKIHNRIRNELMVMAGGTSCHRIRFMEGTLLPADTAIVNSYSVGHSRLVFFCLAMREATVWETILVMPPTLFQYVLQLFKAI